MATQSVPYANRNREKGTKLGGVPDIYRYTDYRSFLNDWFEESKSRQPHMSYRSLGSRIPIDPGNLIRVLRGQRHISEAMAPRFVKALHLTDREALYFQALVPYTKARSEQATGDALQKLLALRELRVKTLAAEQYRFYHEWHHTAVRLLVALGAFNGDADSLARILRPSITSQQAEESIQLLRSLGMIRQDLDGAWSLTDDFISTGDTWKGKAVEEFQRQSIQLALEAFDRHPIEHRSMSTLSLAIPQSKLPELKQITKQFRAQVMRWAGIQENPDSVYQVNIQIFPLSDSLPSTETGHT